MTCKHEASKNAEKYILRLGKNGSYFPFTGYICAKCGEDFYSDGIWWVIQGIPEGVVFRPPLSSDTTEIKVDFVVGYYKLRRT